MLKCRSNQNLVPLPASSTIGGERGVLKAPGLDQEKGQCFQILDLASKPTTSWLVHILNQPQCWNKPQATRTHLTHHGPDSGEATTFPHIVFSAFAHRPTSEWFFVPGLPRRSPEIVPVWTPGTLGAYNSQLRPPIGMRSEATLQLFSRAFQRCVTLHLHTPGLGRFPTFSGRESNCK